MRKIFGWYTDVFLLIIPVFFLPIVVDSFGFGKNWLLVTGGFLGLVLWLMRGFGEKKWTVRLNGVWWVLMMAVVWSFLGWTVNKLALGVRMISVMTPTGMGTLAGLTMWVFLWLQAREGKENKRQVNLLTVAGVVAATSSLLVFLLPANRLPLSWPKENPMISIDGGWSITGSIWAEMTLLGLLVMEWMKRLMAKLKENEKEVGAYVGEAAMVVFFGLIVVLDIFKVTGMKGLVLDLNSSWVIATETLKKNPWFGAGLGNYVNAFNWYRPSSFNMTDGWATIYGAGGMGWMHWWTELGLGGLVLAAAAGWGWLKMKKTEASFWQVGAVMAMVALMPLSLVGLWVAIWLATSSMEGKEYKLKLNFGEGDLNIMPFLVAAVMIAGTGAGTYWAMRIISGEVTMRRSIMAAAKNMAGDTYNLQIKAIERNPYVPGYRRIYAQTNLALAQAILAKENLSDEEKENASTLIQQAVREAKAAVALEPNNYVHWVNLASIYKSIIGLVDGAVDWAFQAYTQAAALDPVNPMVKLDLGGLLFAANRLEEADRVFEQAVLNKPNMANGWYNWAYSAKKLGRLGDAVTRMAQAVALVPIDSGDYEKANKELGEWRKELDEAIKKQQAMVEQQQKEAETLKTPEPLPTGEKEVEVPKTELEPPKMEENTVEGTGVPTE